jgi:hypothetical protein
MSALEEPDAHCQRQLLADSIEKVAVDHFDATLVHKHCLVRSMMAFQWLRA